MVFALTYIVSMRVDIEAMQAVLRGRTALQLKA
jgi:hypothetical protein